MISQYAQQANALNFILGDEEKEKNDGQNSGKDKDEKFSGKGFDKQVGLKGTQISGGQK